MYKAIFYLFVGLGLVFNLVSFNQKGELTNYLIMDFSKTSLEDALIQLDDDTLLHHLKMFDNIKSNKGGLLIRFGRINSDSEKTKIISKHFVCTDCHNLTSEFENISSEDPTDRLEYAKKNNLPFLPGSTLWGILIFKPMRTLF